jgi:hypothetical protein
MSLPGTKLQPSGRYSAQITYKGRVRYLGCYSSEIEAHNTYREAKLTLHGINFEEGTRNVPLADRLAFILSAG